MKVYNTAAATSYCWNIIVKVDCVAEMLCWLALEFRGVPYKVATVSIVLTSKPESCMFVGKLMCLLQSVTLQYISKLHWLPKPQPFQWGKWSKLPTFWDTSAWMFINWPIEGTTGKWLKNHLLKLDWRAQDTSYIIADERLCGFHFSRSWNKQEEKMCL